LFFPDIVKFFILTNNKSFSFITVAGTSTIHKWTNSAGDLEEKYLLNSILQVEFNCSFEIMDRFQRW
jgi:hypothetical protein